MKKFGSKKIMWISLVTIFCGIFVFSAVKIYGIYAEYHAADVVQDELIAYKPLTTNLPSDRQTNELTGQPAENSSVIALKEKYPDICGWLTIDDTNIDYCFAQADDNDKYLRSTLDGEYLISGTLFLDYRCQNDLSGFNSIIYGHKMKNGIMFGDLEKFDDQHYFDTHQTGKIYLPNITYKLEIMAYMIVSSKDETIYDPYAMRQQFVEYIKLNARQYREVDLSAEDTLLTLSTCNYSYDGARSVVIARIEHSTTES